MKFSRAKDRKADERSIIILTFTYIFVKILALKKTVRKGDVMKKIISILLLLCIVVSAISLTSCTKASSGASNSRTFYTYFDTVGTFYDYNGMKKSEFDALADRVEEELSIYHKLYDIYNEYDGMTNIASLNANAGKGAVKVDKKIIDLLSLSKELYSLTDGEMNIAMGAVLSIWHDCRDEATENPDSARVPTDDELKTAAEHTDISKLIIDKEAGTVELCDPGMSLDVGAIAKGYAVEKVAKLIAAEYGDGFVLDVGGNLRVIGTKPDGSGWLAGIRNPDTAALETIVYKTEIKNASLVTSGSYERFYTVGGVRYHHIINSETLFPENYYASVSVLTKSSALSDALSTALFNMEYEELRGFVDRNGGIFVVIVTTEGVVETLGEKPT